MIEHWVVSTAAGLAFGAIALVPGPSVDAAPFHLISMKVFSDRILSPTEKGFTPLELAREVKLGEFAGVGSELNGYAFPENQRVQYFRFQFSPGSAGQQVDLTIFGAKTSLGLEKKVTEVTGVIDQDGNLPVQVSIDAVWPVGFYRADFSFGGKSVGQGAYQIKAVKDRTAPITVQRITIYTLEDNRGVLRNTPKTTDRYLEFHAITTGANTAGATVAWKLSVLDNAGRPAGEVSSREITNWPLENTVIVAHYELPTDWRAGKYLLEYWVNGTAAGTHTFEISP